MVQGGLVDLEDPGRQRIFITYKSHTSPGSDGVKKKKKKNQWHLQGKEIQIRRLNRPSLLWRRSVLVDPVTDS